MIRFTISFLLLFSSITYSQTTSPVKVTWNTIFKSVISYGKINSENSKNSFNAKIDSIGLVNPNLIFRYSKVVNYGETYQTEFKILNSIEVKLHNKWIQNELVDCERDSSLTFLAKNRVKSFLERWIMAEDNSTPDMGLVSPLTRLDSMTSDFCTYLFYSESPGEKLKPEKDYSSAIQLAREGQRAELKKQIEAYEASRFDQSYDEFEHFLYKSLYSIRSAKGGFQDQKTRIYHLIADCNQDFIGDGYMSKPLKYIKYVLFRPDPPSSNLNQLILGFGFYFDPKHYEIKNSVPLNYASLNFTDVQSFTGPYWFIHAGINYPFTSNRANFANLRLDGMFTVGYSSFTIKKQNLPISFSLPGFKYYLGVSPVNQDNSSTYLNLTILATTKAIDFSVFQIDMGFQTGYVGAILKTNTQLQKSVDRYSTNNGMLVSSSPLNDKISLKNTETPGGFVFSPLLVVHVGIFNNFNLTSRASLKNYTLSLEGNYLMAD